MRVIIVENAQAVAQESKDIFIRQLQRKPDSVLGLATGSSPLALYRELILSYETGEVSFEEVTSFNLDEYLGLAPTHSQSYRYFMQSEFFDHINIPADSTHVPNGESLEPLQTCKDYEQAIVEAGGVDIQLLGLGRNGHIGFNEPASSLSSRTRIKALTEETINDNARFFAADEVQPRLSLTMGIGTIMEARTCLLIATGKTKADAVAKMIEGPVSASCPASILQMHANAIVVLDEAAAVSLDDVAFYKFVEEQNRELELSLHGYSSY